MTYERTELDLLTDQQARQLLEARMLPETGPLTDVQRELVRAALLKYVATYHISHKDITRQVEGIGPSTLSEILRNTYHERVKKETLDGHLRTLNDWMEVDARRRQTRPNSKFVETRVAKRMLAAADQASRSASITLCHGPTGVGKSMVAHAIVDKFPGSIYLRISSGNTSASAVRRMLAVRLRLVGVKRPPRDQTPGLTFDERIFDRLRDSHRMLVIDEAHRLSAGALEFVRDVYDECAIPILLLCTKDLLVQIRKDADVDHGQFYSRVDVFDLTAGHDKQPGGKRPLFTVSEIRKLFESDKVRLTTDGQAYLQDVANMLGHGSLRTCRRLMDRAVPVERAVRKVGPTGAVTIPAALLRKIELDAKVDETMRADIRDRRPATAV